MTSLSLNEKTLLLEIEDKEKFMQKAKFLMKSWVFKQTGVDYTVDIFLNF